MIIAVDFDGTCVSGYPNFVDIGAAPVLRELLKVGHSLVLNTLREGNELEIAKKWFEDHNLSLSNGIYMNNKVYANIYIDDRSLGTPMLRGKYGLCVDWVAIGLVFGFGSKVINASKREQENVTRPII